MFGNLTNPNGVYKNLFQHTTFQNLNVYFDKSIESKALMSSKYIFLLAHSTRVSLWVIETMNIISIKLDDAQGISSLQLI